MRWSFKHFSLCTIALLVSLKIFSNLSPAQGQYVPPVRGAPSSSCGGGSRTLIKCSGISSGRSNQNNSFKTAETLFNQGKYDEALRSFQKALQEFRMQRNREGEAEALNGIGLVYFSQAQYPKALEFYEQANSIFKSAGNLAGQGNAFNNIGIVYNALGQYRKALEFHQQALKIRQNIGDLAAQTDSLHDIGNVYSNLGEYSEALKFYQQALEIAKKTDYQALLGRTLNNLAFVYYQLKDYRQALTTLEQSLSIAQKVNDRAGEGFIFDTMGSVYNELGQYAKAVESYRQSVAIAQEIGSPYLEMKAFSNLGLLLEKQSQPVLAIAFLKKSVNLTEQIRQNLQVLTDAEQKAYTETVADTYRSLANLLLSQGRILEAQQVLELLKVQEVRNFTRKARAAGENSGIALSATEEQILQTHGSLIAFGQRVEECQKIRCGELTQLLDRRDALTREYNQTVQRLETEIRTRIANDTAFLDPTKLSRKAKEIIDAQPGTILIYPFVLEDRIWLLWASSGGIIKSLAVPVKRQQLGETVLQFRQLLQEPSSNITQVKATGKQLYDWLIKPIEAELKANKIQNLVFSLDRVTRYIPMSALFDGEKYLVENYAISTVLSADLTDTRDRLPPIVQNTSVLALGLSNAVAGFNPLPNVPTELDAVVKVNSTDSNGIYPGMKFLNQAFDFRALRDNLRGQKILHIATHGSFVPGRPEDSYLLLGTGDKLTIPQIDTLQDLADVHLVVLSACETALGGSDADGVEIAGISYYFLNQGAKAVMASLWQVNDHSTSQLMQRFYGNLARGTEQTPIAKAEALRQAQISMLTGGNETADTRRSIAVQARMNAEPNRLTQPLSHPFYWAAFTLVGNGF